MSALANLLGKVRRLPEGLAELWRRFWENDHKTMLQDLRIQRGQLRDYIAHLQDRERMMTREIRRIESQRFLGVGS